MASVGAAAVRIANLLCDGRPPRPSRVLLLVGVECQENEPSVQFALCSTGTRPIEPDSSVPTIPARQKPETGSPEDQVAAGAPPRTQAQARGSRGLLPGWNRRNRGVWFDWSSARKAERKLDRRLILLTFDTDQQ